MFLKIGCVTIIPLKGNYSIMYHLVFNSFRGKLFHFDSHFWVTKQQRPPFSLTQTIKIAKCHC